MSSTLCWTCGRAYGGCSWSRYKVQEPVPGWTAERRDIRIAPELPKVESYVVTDCPLYIVDRQDHSSDFWTPEQMNCMLDLRRTGVPIKEISAAIGRSPQAIYNQICLLRKNGKLEEENA